MPKIRRWSHAWPERGALTDNPTVIALCAKPPNGPRPQIHDEDGLTIIEYERRRVHFDRATWYAVRDANRGALLMRVRPTRGDPFDLVFTAAELEAVFGEITESRSWNDVRAYHFPNPPRAIEAFKVSRATTTTSAPEQPDNQARPSAAARGSITYPFPLRPDVVLSFELPADLTVHEAARIARFFNGLGIDDSGA